MRVITIYGQPIRCEAAQPGPFALNCQNFPVDHPLQPVNRLSNRQFFRRGIAGFTRYFVMRAQPQPPGLWFEIEFTADIQHQRLIGKRQRVCFQLHDCAAQWDDTQTLRPGKACHRIGPSPGGIYQNIRREAPAVFNRQIPYAVTAFGSEQPRTAMQINPSLAGAGEIMRMKPGHVDIGAGRFPDRARPFLAHPRNCALQCLAPYPLNRDAGWAKPLHKTIERRRIAIATDVQSPPLVKKPVVAQPLPRCQRKRDQFRPAVAFFPKSSGSACGMIAGTIFCLQQQHALPALSQFGGDAGAGNSGADYGKVVIAHACAGATRSRNSAISVITRPRTAGTSRRISWCASSPNVTISPCGRRFAAASDALC